MLGSLPFAVCILLQFHYHDSIPWYLWVVAVLTSLGDPVVKLKKG